MLRSGTKWRTILGWGNLLFMAIPGYLIYQEYKSLYSKPTFQKSIDSLTTMKDDSAWKADSFRDWRIVHLNEKDRWAIYVGQSKSIRTKNGEYTQPMVLYAGKEKRPGILYDDWIRYDTAAKGYGGTGLSEALTFTDSLLAVNWLNSFKVHFPQGKGSPPHLSGR